jgi:hypothetical protein
MSITPATREFLLRIHELVDTKPWPGLDRDGVRPASGVDGARVELRRRDAATEPIGVEVRDREVTVTYGPEHVSFTSRDEALRFVEMLGDGRVELEIARVGLWTTMRSYRDGQTIPFRRTRMPWMTVHPRVERVRFGFTE